MRIGARLLVLILLPLPCILAAVPASADDGPAAHQPHDGEEGHGHAHPRIDVTHPIITESPVPETGFVLRYAFADKGGDDAEHGLAASIEYAFVPTFSVELSLPYAVLDPDDAGPYGRLGDVVLAAKWATYAFAEHGLIPAAGVEVSLPTGRDERDVGSDHIIEVEPFVRFGYVSGPLHVVGTAGVGIPFNQTSEEQDEEEFSVSYNLALIYHVAPNMQAMVELHGESVIGDAAENAFYISPGVTCQPFADESINLGIGVSLPLSGDRDFDYSVNLLAIIHL